MRALFALALLVTAPALAEDVASVLLLQGDVSVQAPGGAHAARVGEGLARDATVLVGEESSVVLYLHNEYLIRLDEDMSLPVSSIVILDAAPTTRSVKEQLDELLYPEERASMPGVDRAERVAGWHARLSAGAAPPPSLSSQARVVAPAPAPSMKEEAFAAPAPPVVEATSSSRAARRREASMAKSAAPVLEISPAPSPSPVAAATAPAPQQADLSALLAILHSEDGRACLTEWTAGLPVSLDHLDVDLRVRDGRVERVLLGQGLSAPRCLQELWVGEELENAPARLLFTAPLAGE
ncbi:MAG: hypothetical protein JXX28_17035 [Deltaproteobacteria bacterium]|nr:hypothetical protein [Deltaproteobacteria bacterium]